MRSIPKRASQVRLLGLIFLLLLVVPSAVRWLDDGMETGLVLCFTSLVCWLSFRDAKLPATTASSYVGLVALGFFTVMLRTELAMICAIACAIVAMKRMSSGADSKSLHGWLKKALNSSHLLAGGVLAMAVILIKMHVLLPDTAVAKSHGESSFIGIVIPMAHAIVGGMGFGLGMLLLWLITFVLALRSRRISVPLLLANIPFPLTLFLAAVRGQEIQGIRYLVWTFVFSILWNIVELGDEAENRSVALKKGGEVFAYALLALVLLALVLLAVPLEIFWIHPIVSDRAKLMASLPAQHLDVLQGKLGVAADIGIIGYFSKANICDMAGLVDGREFARLTVPQRGVAYAAAKPDFLYLNLGQLGLFNQFMPFPDWQVCGEYAMTGLHDKDMHYLIVPQSTAEHICKATSFAHPYPAKRLIALANTTFGVVSPPPVSSSTTSTTAP